MFRKKPARSVPSRERTRPAALRRNNTTQVFSYHANRAPREAQRSRQLDGTLSMGTKMKQIGIRRVAVLVCFAFALGVVVYNTTLTTNPAVVLTGTPAERAGLKEAQVYQRASAELLGATLLNRSKLTFNGKEFQQAFLQKFPEAANVQVTLPILGNQPKVRIDPSPGALTLIDNTGASFIVNERGLVIAKNASRGDQTMAVVNDTSGIKAQLGKQILPSDNVAFILRVRSQLAAKNIQVVSFTLPPATHQLQAKIHDKPYYVTFTFTNNVDQQIGAYLAVQRKLNETKVTPSQYIDVRIGERVFYK